MSDPTPPRTPAASPSLESPGSSGSPGSPGLPGEAPSQPSNPAPPPAKRRWPARLLRGLSWSIGAVVVVAMLLVGLIIGAVHSERGTHMAWLTAVKLLHGKLSGKFEGGALQTGVRLSAVRWADAGTEIKLDRIAGSWSLTRAPLRFSIDYLHLGTLEVRIAPSTSSASSSGMPTDLRLPLQLRVRSLRVDRLIVHQGSTAATAGTTEIDALALHGQSDGRHHAMVLDGVRTEFGSLQAALQLDGIKPFVLSGDAGFTGELNRQAASASVRLSGSLARLIADFDATGFKLNGHGHLEAMPFDPILLNKVSLTLEHVDPRDFSAGAPAADLQVHAELSPVVGPQSSAAGMVVSGPVSIVNAIAGTLEQKRLPLLDAHAQVRLDAHSQSISGLTVNLIRQASLSGSGTLSGAKGHFDLRASRLDLSVLTSSIRATQLGGPITVSLDGARQAIGLDLADPGLALRARARVSLDPNQIGIDTFQLDSGSGHATLKGALRRDANSTYTLQADLGNFDPLSLTTLKPSAAKPVAPKSTLPGPASPRPAASRGAPEARVTGTLSASGALVPVLRTKADFVLKPDSVYDGLPLTGSGTVQWAGTRLLPSDAKLSIAGNSINLRGSFGSAGDRLQFNADAPELGRLGFGLGGAVKADGDVTGSFAHPNLSVNFAADALAVAAARVGHAQGRAELHDGAAGALLLNLDASDVAASNLVLKKVNAHINGTRGAHTIDAAAVGTAFGRPLDLSLAAHGSLLDSPAGTGWKGTVTQLVNRGLPALQLQAPTNLEAGPAHVVLGATRLTLEGAILDLHDLSFDHGHIRSAGSVSDVSVARLLAINQQLGGTAPPIRSDLIFDGDWDFAVTQGGTGYLQIKRRSGDISVDAGRGVAALGLSELGLRVDFMAANRLRAVVQAKASSLGSVDGSLQVPLALRDGALTLADDAPLAGSVDAEVPSLKTTGVLLGPNYQLDGQLALKLNIAGVVAHPKLSGTLNGDQLAATLVDQGVQLNQGLVRIVLSENLVDFQQVEFHGGAGTLKATGRVSLDQSDAALSAHITADQLELFASPDRQLSLSGDAAVSNAGAAGGMQINGKFTVNKALFDLPESSAPALGDDVVVVRADGSLRGGQPTRPAANSEKPVSRFSPRANVAIDLGNNFKFRGAGADLGLQGGITVVSAPAEPLHAVGNVRVTEGSSYTSFGRKLAIENGFFTFNGPVDNPGVNILAMRRNQEVEAGVQVTGTLQAPVARLVSEPNVADNEKLSWLLFGHGTDQGSNISQQSTMSAALGLLGSAGGKRIAQSVGLDEFSVGQSEVGLTDPQVVMLSKAISARLVLGYEQGLTSSGSVLKATYNLSRFWAISTYAGTLNGIDLLFNRRFDGGGGAHPARQ